MTEYTKRRNINRGFMKLEVWQDAMESFKLTSDIMGRAPSIDFRLRSQILDSVQSIASNIAEGYCRRSINEYLYFLNVALGSSGEVMTRVIGIKLIGQLREEDFERFDELHYKVENKLFALVKSLQAKRAEVM
ncbi:MAG: four helix bundle protein [bacterium]|nr:four helix bundle protein [bacterium]